MSASGLRVGFGVGAAVGWAFALSLSIVCAGAAETGWKTWRPGALSFEAPADWRSMEASGRAPLSFGGDAWYFTLAENSRNVEAGALLNLAWTDYGSVYSAGVKPSQIVGVRKIDFAGLPADQVEFKVRDKFNDTAGFDIVPKSPMAGRSLTLTCRAPQAQWPSVKSICERIVASVALSLPATATSGGQRPTETEPTPAAPEAEAPPPATPVLHFQAQNTDAVVGGPKVETSFTVKAPIFLRTLRTYHWNDGRGAAPGTMSLSGPSETKVGSWRTRGEPGQGGVANAYWIAEVNQRLEPGRYTLTTSNDQTWSTNVGVGWKGFYAIEYQNYPEVAQPTPHPASTPTVAATPTPTAEPGLQPLFAGSLEGWLPLETDGGDFKAFARLANGALIVDVPANSNWGKTGIRSKEPMVRFDRAAPAEAQLTFRFDPQRTTSFVVDVGASELGAGMERPRRPDRLEPRRGRRFGRFHALAARQCRDEGEAWPTGSGGVDHADNARRRSQRGRAERTAARGGDPARIDRGRPAHLCARPRAGAKQAGADGPAQRQPETRALGEGGAHRRRGRQCPVRRFAGDAFRRA